MSDLPSWARKGAKVVCIGSFEASRCFRWERLPVVGAVYTIRSVTIVPEGVYLRFREIRNWPAPYDDSFGECRFTVAKFRPLIEGQSDDEVEARLYHKKGLHQSAPRRKSVDA